MLMAMMASKKFMILDFLSGQHPEWTGAKDQANEILAKMQESGFVPKEAFESMKKVIDDHMGTKDFVPTMTKLLKANGYWLPAEPREDIERFVLEFESFCMSPQMPDGIGEESDDSEAPPTASIVTARASVSVCGMGTAANTWVKANTSVIRACSSSRWKMARFVPTRTPRRNLSIFPKAAS